MAFLLLLATTVVVVSGSLSALNFLAARRTRQRQALLRWWAETAERLGLCSAVISMGRRIQISGQYRGHRVSIEVFSTLGSSKTTLDFRMELDEASPSHRQKQPFGPLPLPHGARLLAGAVAARRLVLHASGAVEYRASRTAVDVSWLSRRLELLEQTALSLAVREAELAQTLLAKAMDEPREDVRRRCFRLLFEHFGQSRAARRGRVFATQDSDPVIRLYGAESSVPPAESPSRAARVAKMIAVLDPQCAERFLHRLLEHEDLTFRNVGANLLASIGTTASIEPLTRCAQGWFVNRMLKENVSRAQWRIQSRTRWSNPGQVSLLEDHRGALSAD